MPDIIVQCCEGKDGRNCFKNRCALYREAKATTEAGFPNISTGFGNLYGDPSHEDFLARVRRVLREDPQNT